MLSMRPIEMLNHTLKSENVLIPTVRIYKYFVMWPHSEEIM